MNYILVENGQVVGIPRPLPQNWANVSNFYLLPSEKLKEYGWYPYNFVTAEIGYNQVYDGSDIVIEENEVIEYQKVRNKTEQEIIEETEDKWKSIREERNRLLLECDWTQLPDSPLTNQKQTEWQVYRQELRDITNEPNPFGISWPNQPE